MLRLIKVYYSYFMKILLLTTKTTHHIYFTEKLCEFFSKIDIICEKKLRTQFSYDTDHELDKKQEIYEKQLWFKNKKVDFLTAKAHYYDDINDTQCINFIKKLNPNVVIVFGTGIIKKNLLDILPFNSYNLHGGNPEEYRGLDTNLWAIFHGDFKNCQTTLHKINKKLDTGKIVFKRKIKLNFNLELHQLRAINTEICIELCNKLLNNIKSNKKILFKDQKNIGRYYHAMPSSLKQVCQEKLKKYVKPRRKSSN